MSDNLDKIFRELGMSDGSGEKMDMESAMIIAEENGHAEEATPAFREFPKCQGKNCYSSRQEAEKVKKYQLKRNTGTPGRLASYRCPKCGSFHLTSQR